MKKAAVALVVQNCPAGAYGKNLESTLNFIRAASLRGARFIVFPEMNLTGYTAAKDILSMARPVDSALTDPLSKASKRFRCTILTGLAEKTRGGKIYASHLIFTADGSYQRYTKGKFTYDFGDTGKFTPLHLSRIIFQAGTDLKSWNLTDSVSGFNSAMTPIFRNSPLPWH